MPSAAAVELADLAWGLTESWKIVALFITRSLLSHQVLGSQHFSSPGRVPSAGKFGCLEKSLLVPGEAKASHA